MIAPVKHQRIEARLSTEQKDLFLRAAELSGLSLTDFVVHACQEAASSIVREHEKWVLDKEDSILFVETLINPPKPNEHLVEIARRSKERFF